MESLLSSSLHSPWRLVKSSVHTCFVRASVALRYGILVRSIFYAGILMGATGIAVAAVAWRGAYSFIDSAMEQRLEEGRRTFDYLLEQRSDDLRNLALWLNGDSAVLSYASGANIDIQTALSNLTSLGYADFVVVNRANGEMMVAPDGLTSLEEDITSPLSREDAGAINGNGASVGIVGRRGGTLQWRLEMPIKSGGRVAVGYVLGQAFSDRFKTWTGLDISLYSGEHLAATSLRGPKGERTPDIPLAAEVAEATLKTGGVSKRSFYVGPDRHQAFYFPLYDRAGQIVGIYGVSLPSLVPLSEQVKVLKALLPILLGSMVLAGLSTHLLMRQVIAPLRDLSGAVTRIGAGDLITPVKAGPKDEMMPLAEELEDMRRKLHNALSQLAIERSTYQGIFHYMANAVFTTDEKENITSLNPAAKCLLPNYGSDNDAPEGKKCWGISTLTDGRGRPLCSSACRWLWFKGVEEPLIVKGSLIQAPDKTLDVEVTIAPVRDEKGETVAIVHVLRDITAQEELQRLKDRFLMDVAHELRTPLSSLSASVELLGDDLTRMPLEDSTRMLGNVRRGALKLQTLVANLLDLGSIQAGRFTVRAEPIQIVDPILDAVAISGPILAAKGQRAEVKMPPGLPPVVADHTRLSQVLINVISNANKYGPAGDTIILAVESKPDNLTVYVTDHGPGMPPEEKSRAFEYYYQGESATQSGNGFGLGLAILKGIVEAHGGKVGIDSVIGQGTTVWFSLPTAVDASDVSKRRL